MGKLEESIVTTLEGLRDEEPGFERHMFVFPSSLMSRIEDLSAGLFRVVRRAEVTMVCRSEEG